MSIFNSSFFPTPKPIIEMLLKPYFIERDFGRGLYKITGNVLEPNAGKGDIAEFIEENTNSKIFCIEIEHELQEILKSKSFKLIDTDFLNYQKDMYFDFIIMNPPFDKGEEHLLKAIEISTKTKIACILNAQTIRNPYSEKRKLLLDYINLHNGKVEFVKNAFVDAERKTNVEIAMIWLDINKNETQFNFDFIDDEQINIDTDFSITGNDIVKKDEINNLKIRGEKLKLAYIEKLKADAKFKHYADELTGREYNYDSWIGTSENAFENYSELSNRIKSFQWKNIISHLDIKKFMSSSMISDFDCFVNSQSNLAFTKENVFSFFSMVLNNRENIMLKMIDNVFDNLTAHSYASNAVVVEKWKTNTAFKINRKIIAPAYVRYGVYMSSQDLKKWGDTFSLGYSDWGRTILSDLDKVLMAISGRNLHHSLTILGALEQQFSRIGRIKTGDKFDSSCESAFFKIKFYKKGSIHLEFKDKDLWDEFNYRVGISKNWIPDDEKRYNRKYQNTATEEATSDILQLEFSY